jgi:hypothetical protein
VSEAAAVLVHDRLLPGAALADLGVHRLRDLGRPERIFQLQAAGLQAEFPPLRSLGNPALLNNLPVQLSAFIGREREMAEVRALVESVRLVTLTGAGGCGKTRLGLQVATELLDGSGDGVWLAELAAVTDEDAVAPAISRALRLVVNPGRPVLEALLDALAPQDVLIVVDNCEHLIGGCAKTAEAIVRRCPRVVGAENLCHQAIFVDDATRAVTPPDPEMIQVGVAIWQGPQWRGLVQGAVRPVRIVEILVLPQHQHQVALVPDQGPVQQFTPAAAYPPLHDRIHSRCLDGGADDPGPDCLEHGIEGLREAGVPVMQDELRSCPGLL